MLRQIARTAKGPQTNLPARLKPKTFPFTLSEEMKLNALPIIEKDPVGTAHMILIYYGIKQNLIDNHFFRLVGATQRYVKLYYKHQQICVICTNQ
jgi:hypothetical protein